MMHVSTADQVKPCLSQQHDHCGRRKPKLGMILKKVRERGVIPSKRFMVRDSNIEGVGPATALIDLDHTEPRPILLTTSCVRLGKLRMPSSKPR